MIWTDVIEEYPDETYSHPLYDGQGAVDRKYRPVWHVTRAATGTESGELVADGGRAEESAETPRLPPLNLTEDEAEILWEMVKAGIGQEEIYELDHETVESVHTKVRRLVKDE